jgi:hypothetical protein
LACVAPPAGGQAGTHVVAMPEPALRLAAEDKLLREAPFPDLEALSYEDQPVHAEWPPSDDAPHNCAKRPLRNAASRS